MAPNPQTVITDRKTPQDISSSPLEGNEIVISGISGLFPKSDNTMEFMENLYNQVDMVQEVNSKTCRTPRLPKHLGKIRNTEKFDASFFRVTPMQAATLDGLTRKAMENAYGAIFDAGINPLSLSGSKLGVIVGSSYYDVITITIFDSIKINNFALSGGSKTMQANRISYWINAKGPSYTLDASCASGMACLELAYQSIKRGDCDAAIVGGCNSCFHPVLSANLTSVGLLCLDGKTKCFNRNGDGYVRSEAVSLLFLQKAKDAKRIYAEISHIKGKYFTTPDANFLPTRKPEDIEEFFKEFYSEVKISPSEVEYIEATGSGIAEADGNELNAIGRFFAKTKSINVGSVNSNMGHAEGASGACALSKMCLAYHKGELPANLHFNESQDHIPAVRDRRVQVVTKNTTFNRGYTAINNFSRTGVNYHVLLKGINKAKEHNRYRSYIPHIILLSGREEKGINKTLDKLQSQPIDPEQIALLHNIFKDNIPGHTGRSYIVLDTNEKKETVCLARGFEFYSGTARPLCYLYSGMGSQWCGMGTELLRIPIFAAAIDRCQKVLDPFGVDIVKIITDSDKTIFDNILNSMVGICAIQIGLTDVLKAMEIIPDYIIGHSIGELGCAYADCCFTAEETMLSAYYRGLVSIQTPFIRGSMAAVGLGHSQVLRFCPPEIQVACHNSSESTTISGPADAMKLFLSDLVARGIFAKEVACSNIAYHSKYIAKAGPGLLSYMKHVIKEKKLRSEKWISTSVPQEKWEECAKYASPEYFTNNLLNPVYFEESAALIPNNAVIIEIAPHHLMQAILKRSHNDCVNVALTKRNCAEPVNFLLEAVGKLYQTGSNPQVQALYPKVQFPVSTETPLLSHLVEWEHSVDWPEAKHTIKQVVDTSARNVAMYIDDDDYKFIEEHVRNGVNEFPESGLLVLVWETYGMYFGTYYKDMSVTFSDVKFHDQLIMNDKVLRLRILIKKGSNTFEVMNEKRLIVSGVIIHEALTYNYVEKVTVTEDIDITLYEEDLYTLLSLKGHSYGDSFRSICSLNTTKNEAYVKWTGQWTAFLDSLIQLKLFTRNYDGVSVPKIIQKLIINTNKHKMEERILLNGTTSYKAKLLASQIRCGGVVLEGIIFEDRPKAELQPDMLFDRKFVPHVVQETINLNTAISFNLQLVAEEILSDKISILELSSSQLISNMIQEISNTIPTHELKINWIDINKNIIKIEDLSGNDLYFVHNLLGGQKVPALLNNLLNDDTFVLTLENNITNIRNKDLSFNTITSMPTEKGTLVLLKKVVQQEIENVTYIQIKHEDNFSWLPRVQCALQQPQRVVLVSDRQPYCGLLGLLKNLRKSKGNNISLLLVDNLNTSSASFSPETGIYEKQLRKTLAINILKVGLWGNYYNLPCSKVKIMQNVRLSISNFKEFVDFTWVENSLSSNKNFVKVSYAGLSAKDCQKARNYLKDNNNYMFGMDFSGYDFNDKKVMGLVAGGAIGSTVETESALLWPVPQHWSLEDAATVPLPYAHAYYCLAFKAQLLRNQSVFVVGGCGALGQAVIAICLSLDCTVFASVGNITKKILLLQLFPALKEENIVCSYDDYFNANIIDITKNNKCHHVINTASGYLREVAMKCIGIVCKFLDVSDVDMNKNEYFGMSFLGKFTSYISVDLSSVFRPENAAERKEIHYMVAEGIANGTVRPLSRVVYSTLEVSRAFKLVSSRKNIGRALIKMDSGSFSAIPRMNYSQGVHIVVCDKLNSGFELVNHLIKKEAKNLIVNVKKNELVTNSHAKFASWMKNDITIKIHSENLQTKEGCKILINAGQKLGSVVGIFIAQDYKGKTNSDIIVENELKTSFNDTAVVVANLDTVSRSICEELSNFVIISISSNDPANEYAFSACENIFRARKELGFPALVLRSVDPKEKKLSINMQIKSQTQSLPVLLNAMDISLKLKYDNIRAFKLPLQYTVFNEIIERILGVEKYNAVDEMLTLDNIGYVDDNIQELRSELGLIDQSIDDLKMMTFARLMNLYIESKQKQTYSNVGLKVFYNHVEKNECLTLETFIPAKTLLPVPEDHGYLDRTENHLLMIPSFEGIHYLYKKHFEYPSKFYILGYSFGINVALEVAKLLEAEGLTGVIYCLDSSPDALRFQLDTYTENMTDHKLQNSIQEHMCRLMTGKEDMELQEELENIDTWSDKIEICLKGMHGLVAFSKDYMQSVLRSAYNRIVLAREYKPQLMLESELVLMRGISNSILNLADDYNLSKYTKKPVKVFQIESDHVSAPYDTRVSNIINKMLDPQLLEEFKTKNLCEFYYIK